MADEDIKRLQAEFRAALERFYAGLKLAPPYHSVEKAVAALGAALKQCGAAERERLAADAAGRWQRYAEAFVAGGLHLKHRGPILSLVRAGQTADLAPEFQPWLEACERGR